MSYSLWIGKTARIFLTLCAAVALVIGGFLFYRSKVMDHLYAQAVGYPPYLRNSKESTTAVKKLAAYRGRRATEMLVNIALGNGPAQLIWPDTQAEAIKALRDRDDPDVAVALANLLQPHNGLDTRQAAAAALQSLPCNAECARSILHYLERVWGGEPNYEDRTVRPPGFEDVKTGLRKDQQVLYSHLYSVLQREKVSTLMTLVEVYGLGSPAPSPFALDLVSRLHLQEACPYLMQSDQELNKLSPDSYKAPRQELQAAINALSCR